MELTFQFLVYERGASGALLLGSVFHVQPSGPQTHRPRACTRQGRAREHVRQPARQRPALLLLLLLKGREETRGLFFPLLLLLLSASQPNTV